MKLFLASALTLAISASAAAAPMYDQSVLLSDCDDAGCRGVTYFVGIDEVATQEYEVTIRINADGYFGNRDGIIQIGGLFIKGWTDVDLISAPSAGWADPVGSPISANSTCSKDSNPNQSKICSHGFTDITGGGDYEWMFSVIGGQILDPMDMHFGGQFGDTAGKVAGQVISAGVPEPSAAVVFAAGLLVTSRALRRKRA